MQLRILREKRLEIHKKVHGRKSKVSEYGCSEINQDRLRLNLIFHFSGI